MSWDTDTCLYLLNVNLQAKERVALIGVEVIAVTVVTKGELYFGAYNSSKVDHNLERISAINIYSHRHQKNLYTRFQL